MTEGAFEIERKFLIRMPDLAWLSSVAEASKIIQTYLRGGDPNSSERVRSRESGGKTIYTHTEKLRLSARKRIEVENEIGWEEYERLLLRADPQRRTIEKTRYCLPIGSLVYEIDVFPFWHKQAFLEIELSDENQTFPWPDGIQCIRELTDDSRYTNSALALCIPEED